MTMQRTATWVKTATAEQIDTAHTAGELDEYLAVSNVAPPPGEVEPVNPEGRLIVQRGAQWVKAATAEQLAAAVDRGELAEYLGATVNELGNIISKGA